MKLCKSLLGSCVSVFLVACGAGSGSGESQDADAPDALLSSLETRLLEAERVEIRFHVQAEGAVAADLHGDLEILGGGVTQLTATGVFAEESVELFVISDGSNYEFGNQSSRISSPTPEYLNEALLVGLTRMGILHNLAMLTASAPPDRVYGGVRDWATVDGFGPVLTDENAQGLRSLFFALTVDGVPAGTAELDLDQNGLPTGRRQLVQFPEGEMRVVESYSSVVIRP